MLIEDLGEDEALDEADEFALAQRVTASSTTAAMVPRRPVAKIEPEDEDAGLCELGP